MMSGLTTGSARGARHAPRHRRRVRGCGRLRPPGVASLAAVIGSELTTLSVCDLDSSHRSVVSDAPGAISARQIEVFDRYFPEHPLVRAHGRNPAAVTKRISDLVPKEAFLETPLYNDYYRPIGIRHTMALPIYVDRRLLVSFVFNRASSAFGERELRLAETLRPHLANLYRLVGAKTPVSTAALTAREREVLDWVAAGKTNAISPRSSARGRAPSKSTSSASTRSSASRRAPRPPRGRGSSRVY